MRKLMLSLLQSSVFLKLTLFSEIWVGVFFNIYKHKTKQHNIQYRWSISVLIFHQEPLSFLLHIALVLPFSNALRTDLTLYSLSWFKSRAQQNCFKSTLKHSFYPRPSSPSLTVCIEPDWENDLKYSSATYLLSKKGAEEDSSVGGESCPFLSTQ